MKRYKNYQEIVNELGDDIVIIEYPFRWGGQFADKSFWCAFIWKTGEAYDYHTKEHLKKDLSKEGYKWIVVRNHLKNKGVTILERSEKLIATTLNSKGSPSENSLNMGDKVTATPSPKDASHPSHNPHIQRNFKIALKDKEKLK